MLTTFRYRRIDENGEAVPLEELKAEVEQAWPDHQTYIDKVLCGLGMTEWRVGFYPSRHRFWAGGHLVTPFKMILLESHSKDEMLTTLLHEILHYRNHGVPEEEIERRSLLWFKALQSQ